MGNAFVNAFAVLEPATGTDGFSRREAPRKPAAFFEARAGMNRLFRANLAFAPAPVEIESPAEFVVGEFLKRQKQI